MGSKRRWPIADYNEDLGTPRNISRFYPDYRSKGFIVHMGKRRLFYPFAMLDPRPTLKDPFIRGYADGTFGNEVVHYVLQSGKQGRISAEDVLHYYREVSELRGKVLYTLSIEAWERIQQSPLSRRQILKRLRTSASQLDRLLDETNFYKSINGVLDLLEVLGCDVDITVRSRKE